MNTSKSPRALAMAARIDALQICDAPSYAPSMLRSIRMALALAAPLAFGGFFLAFVAAVAS